ncbi:MAG: hypothetical protein D6819_10875 [Gammaproteobacteria bacterium]|nr:MAG: hypothetical protein D6819_10875 [Gammaproteobacteria bacterium]
MKRLTGEGWATTSPSSSPPPEAIAILGMVAYFSVMEMTDNQALLLPLMTASFIAFATSRLVCPRPIYRAPAEDFLEKQPKGAH